MNGIVVVGDGAAARRLTRALAERGHRGPVTVLGRRTGPPRERALLPALLDGSLPPDAALLPGHPEGVRVHEGVTAVRLDRGRRVVHTSAGGRVPYDRLVLATGSRTRLPRLAGSGARPGGDVFTPHTLDDPGRLPPGRVLVLGGGPHGTELALALLRGGRQVGLVHPGDLPMHRHLDAPAGRLLRRLLVEAGAELHLGRTGTEYAPGKLTLDDGSVLAADALVLCTGTVARTGLARGAGLAATRSGIVVDGRLGTADPLVSALGDCARLPSPPVLPERSSCAPPGPVAWDAADALAARLAGGGARDAGTAPPGLVRLRGAAVAVLGSRTALDTAPEQVTLDDPAGGRYARLGLDGHGRIAGAVLYGLPDAIAAATQLYERGLPVPATRLALLLGTAPRAAAGAELPGEAVLCRCNNVSRRTLATAWTRGARDVAGLAAATRATTGCGGCAPDIERLCASLATEAESDAA